MEWRALTLSRRGGEILRPGKDLIEGRDYTTNLLLTLYYVQV